MTNVPFGSMGAHDGYEAATVRPYAVTGGRVRSATSDLPLEALVEVNDAMQPGHVSLPNGFGVGESSDTVGVAPNELTDSFARDPIAGTPWHKSVPARLEPVA